MTFIKDSFAVVFIIFLAYFAINFGCLLIDQCAVEQGWMQ